MRPTLPKLLAASALASLAACTAPQPVARTTTAAAPAGPQSTPATAQAGESCLELTRIRESRVIDDRTIDFVTNDGRVYRNTLPYSCPQLGFERAFSYATSLSRLCSVDIITVIVQGGGVRQGASCGLGRFVLQPPAAPASR